MPIAAALSQRADPRILITFGLTLFAGGLYLFSFMTPDWGFAAPVLAPGRAKFRDHAVHRASVGLALGGFEGPELRYASGLFNLMRNLGGAIGIAVVNTWLQDMTRLHALRLSEALGMSARGADAMIAGLSHQFAQLTPDMDRARLMAES